MAIPGIRHIHSSISLKLLSAFLVIVVLSLFALILTLNALNKTQETQQQLTQEALPLLGASEEFSLALFEHLALLQQLAAIQNNRNDLSEQLKMQEKILESKHSELQRLTNNIIDITPITTSLGVILRSSENLQILIFEARPLKLAAIKKHAEDIRQGLQSMRKSIRRHQILKPNQPSSQQNLVRNIEEELVRIDEVMSQYSALISLEELKYLKSRYTIAVRNITQRLAQLNERSLREVIAKTTNNLFNHIVDKKGFFQDTSSLTSVNIKVAEIIENNIRKEQAVNILLGQLLETVSDRTDDELIAFDKTVSRTINLVIIITLVIIILSLALFYFYIVPRITRRLNRLANDTLAISSGKYDITIDTSGEDEVSQMAKSLEGFRHSLIEKEKAEAEREKLVTQLVNSNEELERFAYVCSHDLQEPLRMIRSFSEKLQYHMEDHFEQDEKGKKYFRFVTDGAERAQELIADILTYSSIDNDTKLLEEVDCNEIVRAVKESMQLTIEEKNAAISYDVLPKLRGNKTQIFQLFQNLINNGIKYQEANTTPTVHVSVENKGDFYLFSITDNGIGIEERHLKKIFDVFQRLHRKSLYAGTGIGLSICKKVVERHGGTIWVTSEKGVGSAFYFTLQQNHEEKANNE